MASTVPRDPTLSPEMRRFLDDLARVANIFDGKTATEATALLNVFTSTLNGLAPLSGGGTVNFLRADATWAPPANTVLQCLQTTYTTNADITNTIPLDDTTPLITEGDQILSLAITPADNSNKILVEVGLYGAMSTNNTACIVAVFRGSTCIQAVHNSFPIANFPATIIPPTILDSPASASAQTYSVRVGVSSNTLRLNGTPGAGRLFGGAAACTLTLTEIAA